MCQVDSFFCGLADLRKGTLIIGCIKLVIMMMIDHDDEGDDDDDDDNDHICEDLNFVTTGSRPSNNLLTVDSLNLKDRGSSFCIFRFWHSSN